MMEVVSPLNSLSPPEGRIRPTVLRKCIFFLMESRRDDSHHVPSLGFLMIFLKAGGWWRKRKCPEPNWRECYYAALVYRSRLLSASYKPLEAARAGDEQPGLARGPPMNCKARPLRLRDCARVPPSVLDGGRQPARA